MKKNIEGYFFLLVVVFVCEIFVCLLGGVFFVLRISVMMQSYMYVQRAGEEVMLKKKENKYRKQFRRLSSYLFSTYLEIMSSLDLVSI